MLTKGFKNEERRKIDQVLKAGLQLDFVPELWLDSTRQKVETLFDRLLNTDIKTVKTCSYQTLIEILNDKKFGFSNKEKFADLLVKMTAAEPDQQSLLAEKAVAIYRHIQAKSKTFSFGISQKINSTQKLINPS